MLCQRVYGSCVVLVLNRQVAGAGGNGAVVFGRLVGTQLSWQNFECVLTDPLHIAVTDVFNESTEELDFRDRVVEMALGYGHLVVATPSQCYLYNVNNWNTPHMFDLRGTVSLIILSEKHFLMVDTIVGVQVYSYDGRQLSSPRFAGMRVELLSASTVSLGPDCVAMVDKSDGKSESRVCVCVCVCVCGGVCVSFRRSPLSLARPSRPGV